LSSWWFTIAGVLLVRLEWASAAKAAARPVWAADTSLSTAWPTAHVGRHTFVTRLIRGGEDLVTVAELAGQARLETLKVYSHPTDEDKQSALRHLTVDR
jgi:site-specific recombinase XerD